LFVHPPQYDLAGQDRLALACLRRHVPVLLVPNINWADEIFQATKKAHRPVCGTGLLPLGARSCLLPGSIAGLMELARLLGDGPRFYLPVIAPALATLSAVPIACCFRWARQRFGLAGAIVGGRRSGTCQPELGKMMPFPEPLATLRPPTSIPGQYAP
jgi:hypothetical protein